MTKRNEEDADPGKVLSIRGQVVLEFLSTPVGGVFLRAFDVASVRPGGAGHPTALTLKDAAWVATGKSLGSCISRPDGGFRIDHAAGAAVLVLVAYRRNGGQDRAVFISPDLLDAPTGRQEFLVQISPDDFLLDPQASADALSQALERSGAFAAVLRERMHEKTAHAVRDRQDKTAAYRTQINEALRQRARGKFTDAAGVVAPTYVDTGDTVPATQMRAHRKTLQKIGSTRFEALVDLDEAARATLLDVQGAPLGTATSDQIRDILLDDARNPATSNWSFHDAIGIDCRRLRFIHDLRASTDGNAPGGDNRVPAAAPPLSADDIKGKLSSLLAHLDRPEREECGEARATLDRLNGHVHELDLTGGAADQTALFDFENLHFAFDHVWQDIFDPWWQSLIAEDLAAADTLARPVEAPADGNPPDLHAILKRVEREALNLRARATDNRGDVVEPDFLAFGLGNFGRWIVETVYDGYNAVRDLYVDNDSDDVPRPDVVDHRDDTDTPPPRPSKRRKNRRMKTLNSYIAAMDRLIAADHEFTAFGADDTGHSVNYGVITTYRQRWDPQSYQAGELVKTLPLAPGQKMTYSTKRTVQKSHNEKRAEASENTYNSESDGTERDISKIVRNAKFDTSFTMQSKVNTSIPGVGGAEAQNTFGTNFSVQSSRTKETFREQVKKEAASFKNSASVEVNTSQSSQFSEDVTGQIVNENNEISVTGLFYELQRRYLVSEQLHRVTPVVLIAEEVWKPGDITPELIARYDWIFLRVLLDESFAAAIKFVASGELAADHAALFDLEDLMEVQFDIVDSLKVQIAQEERSIISPSDYKPDIFRNDRGQTVEEYQNELKAHVRDLQEELRRQEGSLASAVEQFNDAFTDYATKVIQIRRLQLHIKDNVIYYLQAVWEHQDNHQTFMRLRNQQVTKITGRVHYSLAPSGRSEEPPWWRAPFKVTARPIDFDVSDKTQALAEVADLFRPLGYFGNYRIYPLIQMNPMIEFLLVPYLSGHPGVRDPDSAGNYTIGGLQHYVKCLADTLPQAEFEALRPKIEAAYERRLSNPLPDQEEIVVPTGSLFIELLPGRHSVLEQYKREHRALDVRVAADELVTTRLEQLRMAARILSDRLGDPEVEKVVVTDRNDLDLGDI